jgi:hypothetical protein
MRKSFNGLYALTCQRLLEGIEPAHQRKRYRYERVALVHASANVQNASLHEASVR